ncbi:hypothetical protein E4U13_004205 [Claviceps humidiphila]|uniref:Uncharacterized protein n=1 Tax=Claviceps humidiphila TaxID=1294629 RepID=A0A9P7PYV0_9HYPO|nr:hypothetical protein E4U13_004205 [Claviceps humidiphila]
MCSLVKTFGYNTAWDSFPAAKSFTWPDENPPLAYFSISILVSDSPPRQVNVKHQAEVIRRDRLMTKEDKEIRRKAIHQRNWREPINVHAVKQLREGSL